MTLLHDKNPIRHLARKLKVFSSRLKTINSRKICFAYEPKYENINYATNISCDKNSWNIYGYAYDALNSNTQVAWYNFHIDQQYKKSYFAHIEVRDAYRGQNFTRELISNALTFCYEHGIYKIEVTATKDGLLVWPRYGFSPDPGNSIFYNRIRIQYHEFVGMPFPENLTLPKRGPEILNYVAPYNREENPNGPPREAKIGRMAFEAYQAHKQPKFSQFYDGFEITAVRLKIEQNQLIPVVL